MHGKTMEVSEAKLELLAVVRFFLPQGDFLLHALFYYYYAQGYFGTYRYIGLYLYQHMFMCVRKTFLHNIHNHSHRCFISLHIHEREWTVSESEYALHLYVKCAIVGLGG